MSRSKTRKLNGIPTENATIAHRVRRCGVYRFVMSSQSIDRAACALHSQNHFATLVAEPGNLDRTGCDYVYEANWVVFAKDGLAAGKCAFRCAGGQFRLRRRRQVRE